LWWGGRYVAPLVRPAVHGAASYGRAAPLAFIALYIVAVVSLIPGAWLTFAGGAVFGVVPCVLYSIVGGTVGSTLAFLIGRYAARAAVERHLASMPKLRAIESAVSRRGRRVVFLLRLSPIAPFNFLNYVLGLTTISAADFVIASAGMVPSTVMYAYTGAVIGESFEIARQAPTPHAASYYGMLLLGLAATIGATVVVGRAARAALRDV